MEKVTLFFCLFCFINAIKARFDVNICHLHSFIYYTEASARYPRLYCGFDIGA